MDVETVPRRKIIDLSLEEGLKGHLECLLNAMNDCRDSLIVANAERRIVHFSEIAWIGNKFLVALCRNRSAG
jgi:hypothetical protein